MTTEEGPDVQEARRIAGENFALLWGLLLDEIDRRIKDGLATAAVTQQSQPSSEGTLDPQPVNVSPWMTIKEVAAWARRSYGYVWDALIEYERSNGSRGLRGAQIKPNAKHMVHVDDAEKWVRGERPLRNPRKFQVAS